MRSLNVTKTVLSIKICRFKASPLNIPTGFFKELSNDSKIHMGEQRTKNRLDNSETKTYLKAIVIKTMWYWCWARQRDQ